MVTQEVITSEDLIDGQTLLFEEKASDDQDNFPVPRINGDMLVVKENSLARTALNLSLPEHRLVSVISSLISPNDLPGKKYYFYIKDYCEFFGLDDDGNHTQLRSTFLSLRSKSFVIKRKGEDHITGWINFARIIKRTGIVEVDIDPKILPFLLYVQDNIKLNGQDRIGIDPKIGFTKHQLENVRYFTTVYAFNLYTFLRSLLNENKSMSYYVNIDQLRSILVVDPKKYTSYTGLKTRVFLPAVAEINGDMELLEDLKRKKVTKNNCSPTDVKITFNEKRGKQNKVEGVMLHLSKIDINVRVEKSVTDEIVKVITDVGISEKIAAKIIKEYSKEQILSNIEYATKTYKDSQSTSNPIRNLAGFAKHCVEENKAQRSIYEQEVISAKEKAKRERDEAIAQIAATSSNDEDIVILTPELEAQIAIYLKGLTEDELADQFLNCKNEITLNNPDFVLLPKFTIDQIKKKAPNMVKRLFYQYLVPKISIQ